MRKNLHQIILVVAALLFSIQITLAQNDGPVLKGVLSGKDNKEVKNKESSKLSPDLRNLYNMNLQKTGRTQAKVIPGLPATGLDDVIQMIGDMVVVDITILEADDPKAIAELESLGVKVSAVFGRVVSGMMLIESLPKLESAATIRFVQPAYKPMHQGKPIGKPVRAGKQFFAVTPVISQGDTAQRSYLARSKRVDGKGVKVGILSDSYNSLGGADRGVLGGELPGLTNPLGYTKPVQVLKDYINPNNLDEGRAMAEIVHDVAPGSPLAFHTAFLGQADFANGILDLAKAGCDVITDDVFYFAEPFFQDGIIAQAVDKVAKKGVTYFSAAGNQSNLSYESQYRPTPIAPTIPPLGGGLGTLHNFSDPGDPTQYYFQPIIIPRGGTLLCSFQWDQPFFSAGGEGATTDMDILLLNPQAIAVAGGLSDNILSGDPVEFLRYTNNTANTIFWIAILKYSGPDPTRLKYVFYGNGGFYPNIALAGINAPTLVGHANAKGAIATAAVPFYRTPAYGVNPPRVENFSSLGGVAIYFNKKGERKAPDVRRKPEITAPDGGNTSFFPPFPFADIPQDVDTYPNFFGTSAAAPHAAGAAALMIDAQKLKTITPDQIKGILSANTVDMDNIYTPGFDAGFDFNTGTGLIKADAAVDAVRFPNVYVKDLKLEALCSDNPAKKLNWKITNPNPFDVEVRWLLTGFGQSDNLVVPPGETTFTTNTATLYNNPVPNIVIIEWADNFAIPHFDLEVNTGATCEQYVVTGANQDKNFIEDVDAKTSSKQNIAEVYPNPSSANFRLYLSLASQQNTDIELYSIDGRMIFKKQVPSKGIVTIDALKYNPGAYLLKVKQGGFTKTLQLIKK